MKTNRKLGSYYTPIYFAKSIALWAIRSPKDTVLDPSFGGCAFIEVSLHRLSSLGNNRPQSNIFGYDIDPIAFEYLSKLLGKYDRNHFIDQDYLTSADGKYDVIIGNPPYIKYDNIPSNALSKAREAIKSVPVKLGRANYWAYFLLHATTQLAPAGRMALILPRAFLESDYSVQIWKILSTLFKNIDVFPIRDQIFDDTAESTILALFDYYGEEQVAVIKVHETMNSQSIIENMKTIIDNETENISETSRVIANRTLNNIIEKYKIEKMSHYFTASIGIVTGDKKFFIFDRRDEIVERIGMKYLFPVVSKAQSLTRPDIDKAVASALPLVLCIPVDYQKSGFYSDRNIDEYLDSATDRTRGTSHAQKRKPWYSIKSVFPPDAMVKNIVSGDAVIYMNSEKVLCTNNLNRLVLKSQFSLKSLAIFSRTSLFQLSIYLSAKKYGHAAIKIEPSVLNKVFIPYKNLELIYSSAYLDKLIIEETDIIDAIVLGEVLEMTVQEIAKIRSALAKFKYKNGFK